MDGVVDGRPKSICQVLPCQNTTRWGWWSQARHGKDHAGSGGGLRTVVGPEYLVFSEFSLFCISIIEKCSSLNDMLSSDAVKQ